MKWSAVLAKEVTKKCDGFVVGVYEGDKEWFKSAAFLDSLDRETKKFLEEVFDSKRFQGKDTEIFFSYLPGFKKSRSVFLAGLGKKENHDLEKLRRVIGRVLKGAQKQKLETLVLNLKSLCPQKISCQDASRAAIEAGILATFRFDKYKSKKDNGKEFQSVDLIVDDHLEKKEVREGLKLGRLIGEAANLARTLASEPANHMTPRILAERARELAKEAGLSCKILDEKEIKKLGMGGLLGVAQGSHEPPRFIILETQTKDKSRKPIVLVGKGITFDSGGISLKPAEGMEKMKYDMSGAAAVIASLWLAGKMNLPIKLVGIAPTCENLPSEHPQRPGDIVTISNGKTVEVINTDAEGRLILADGLSYATKYNPRYIIDFATLTGSCRATFGEYAIGMMGNNRALLDGLKEAGEKSGERCWELPLWDDYKDHIKSDFADIKNVGKGVAGAIIGGKFLQEFVGDFPWVQLDIASTGWFDEGHPYIAKGSSGAGVRLFAQFLRDLQ